MPYSYKKVGNKYCVYKKDTGAKVGCTKGTRQAINKYLSALHRNVDDESKQILVDKIYKKVIERLKNNKLNEGAENAVVRNIQAKENFDTFIAKPENKGIPFTQREMDTVERADVKPYKKTSTEIRYSAVEPMNQKNKELVIVKKPTNYVAYFTIRNPVNVTPEEPATDITATPEEPIKDTIVIKVSQPYSNEAESMSALSNFINVITKENSMG